MKKKWILAGGLSLMLCLGATGYATNSTAGNVTVDDLNDSTKITVKGTYQAAATPEKVYSVKIEWTDMSFTYTAGKKTWHPNSLSYTEKSGTWSNPATITVTNRSNDGVKVVPTYNAGTDFGSATMTFDNGTLSLGTADNNKGANGAGQATSGTITVTPEGMLPEGTNGAAIGTITLTVSSENGQ